MDVVALAVVKKTSTLTMVAVLEVYGFAQSPIRIGSDAPRDVPVKTTYHVNSVDTTT